MPPDLGGLKSMAQDDGEHMGPCPVGGSIRSVFGAPDATEPDVMRGRAVAGDHGEVKTRVPVTSADLPGGPG